MEAEAQTDPLVPLVTGCHWVSPLNIGWTDSCVPYQATPRCHLWTTDVRSRVARANTLDNPGHSRHRHLGRGAIQCLPHVPPSTLSTQLEGVGGSGSLGADGPGLSKQTGLMSPCVGQTCDNPQHMHSASRRPWAGRGGGPASSLPALTRGNKPAAKPFYPCSRGGGLGGGWHTRG